MLVLARKTHEKVFLDLPDGSRIEILVTEIVHRDKVRLGITAPNNVRIMRDELLPPARPAPGGKPS